MSSEKGGVKFKRGREKIVQFLLPKATSAKLFSIVSLNFFYQNNNFFCQNICKYLNIKGEGLKREGLEGGGFEGFFLEGGLDGKGGQFSQLLLDLLFTCQLRDVVSLIIFDLRFLGYFILLKYFLIVFYFKHKQIFKFKLNEKKVELKKLVWRG